MVRETWRANFDRPSDIEFRELLERLPAAAYTTDADGLITWYNASAVEVWGREPRLNESSDRFCGSFRLFHVDGTPMAHADCWMGLALRDRIAYNGHEVVIERESGERRTAVAHANPIFDGERLVGAVNVLMDITDRKRAELQIAEANEAKTQFLAVLAHELRNPLAPMRNALELVERGVDEAGLQRAHDTLDRQLRHLTRIVDDLLDVARITRGSLELRRSPIDITPILAQAVETVRPLTEAKGQRLVVEAPDEPIVIDGDPIRLAQLVGNLLGNASKYSESGRPIHLRAERLGSDLVISVRDEGIGIPPEALPTIFEMFSRGTAAASHDGLGVGLTLARQLAEMHGGFIEARSEGIGTGSEFRVHLPAVLDARELAPRPARGSARVRAPKGRRVLVVDDNRDAAGSLAELLGLDGHEALMAHDGAAAVELAASWGPDVILLDIGLPRLDGYEAARRIRAGHAGDRIRLIAVTGWGQAEDRLKSAAAGFDHHIVKPVDLAALSELLAAG